jgi:hypothetical protein
MNARELRDNWQRLTVAETLKEEPLILRALDLLVAVEDSGDELVKELHKREEVLSLHGFCAAARAMTKAAARIVAQAERIKVIENWAQQEAALRDKAEFERDSLKRHAEAMAHYTECYGDKFPDSGANLILADYRRDSPKEEA